MPTAVRSRYVWILNKLLGDLLLLASKLKRGLCQLGPRLSTWLRWLQDLGPIPRYRLSVELNSKATPKLSRFIILLTSRKERKHQEHAITVTKRIWHAIHPDPVNDVFRGAYWTHVRTLHENERNIYLMYQPIWSKLCQWRKVAPWLQINKHRILTGTTKCTRLPCSNIQHLYQTMHNKDLRS